MDTSKKMPIIFSLILLLLLTFAFLDIGVYSSNNNSDSAVSAYSSGNVTSLQSGKLQSDNIILYVPPEDGPGAGMTKDLVEALGNIGYSVILTDELKDDYGSQFAFVNVLDSRVLYTPVYSSADVGLVFGYSSSGSTEYLDVEGSDETQVVMFSSNGTDDYQLLAEGDISFHDETKGLFTYRSYHNHLAEELAKSVANALDSQIKAGR